MKKNTTTNRKNTKKEAAKKYAGRIVNVKYKGQPVDLYRLDTDKMPKALEAILTATSKDNAVKVYSSFEIKQFGQAKMSGSANEPRPYQYRVTRAQFDELFTVAK